MFIRKRSKHTHDPELGMTLLETIVILAVIATIAVVFLNGLLATSNATLIAKKQETAGNLARLQMEWAQETTYVDDAASYTPAAIPDLSDYNGYSAQISSQPLASPDEGLQKITVTIFLNGDKVTSLESYKRKVASG